MTKELTCENAKLAHNRGMMHLAAECDCEECNQVLGRAQPKYKRVNLDSMKGSHSGYGSEYTSYNAAIDDIKSKYGDLYVVIEK